MPVALITGGSKRLGAAIAKRLHQANYDIMIHYHQSQDAAQQLCHDLCQKRPLSAACIQADFSDIQQVEHIIPATLEAFGRLDCLISNASTFYPTPFGKQSIDLCDKIYQTNTHVPLLMAQQAEPYLRQNQGAIINMLDIHAERPLQHHLLYSASKAALRAITQGLAIEMAPNVRVNGIAPGAILWPEHAENTAKKRLEQSIPLNRIGLVEEIAEAALYLAKNATYTTGQILNIDGGRSAQGYTGAAN